MCGTLINTPERRACEVCGTAAPAAHIASIDSFRNFRGQNSTKQDPPLSKSNMAKQFRSVVELVEMALSRVNVPECDDAPVLFCMGGGLAFQDLSRRLHHDINRANRKRVSSVVLRGSMQHGLLLHGQDLATRRIGSQMRRGHRLRHRKLLPECLRKL